MNKEKTSPACRFWIDTVGYLGPCKNKSKESLLVGTVHSTIYSTRLPRKTRK
jgi:hypothetical protein